MPNLIAATQDLGVLEPPASAFAPDLSKNAADPASVGGEVLVKFMSTFIGLLTTLAGLMFLIYFIIAALNWVTAGGEKGKVESARQQMTNGALGLIVVIATYSIVGIVGGVVGLDILNPIEVLRKLQP